MKKAWIFVIAIILSLAFHGVSLADPIFSIDTLQQWAFEISPAGHVRPILTWEQGGFEDLYPGQSSFFRAPSLSAIVDTTGDPGVDLGFHGQTGGIITAISYVFAAGSSAREPQDLRGGVFSFTIAGASKPGEKYSIKVTDINGVRRSGSWDIPVGVNTHPPVSHSVNELTTGTGSFDFAHVTEVTVDYNTSPILNPERNTYLFDHWHTTIPEPASFALFGTGILFLLVYSFRQARSASPSGND